MRQLAGITAKESTRSMLRGNTLNVLLFWCSNTPFDGVLRHHSLDVECAILCTIHVLILFALNALFFALGNAQVEEAIGAADMLYSLLTCYTSF
jgi:hypothetical protein